jgi:hypothetical protein
VTTRVDPAIENGSVPATTIVNFISRGLGVAATRDTLGGKAARRHSSAR